MGNCLNLGGLPDWLVGGEATLGVDEVGGENGVNESRFSQASLSWKHVRFKLFEKLRTPWGFGKESEG